MSAISVRTRRWTRVDERMIDRGIFRDDERRELVDGLLVVKEPQGDPHAHAVDLVTAALRHAFGAGWLIRLHAPLALGGRSRPEPDVVVVRGGPRDHRRAPTTAALVIEVSDSGLALDRTRKAPIDPRRFDLPQRGWGYRSIVTVRPPATITALAAPETPIVVGDLLP